MPPQPNTPYPPLRSQISTGLIFAIPFLGLFIVVGLFLVYTGWETHDPMHRLMGLAFMALPVFLYVMMVQGYRAFSMEDGWVNLRGLFEKRSFPVSDIKGYAVLYRRNKNAMTETLHLLLSDESVIKIESSFYRNYAEIHSALTRGKSLDPVFQAEVKKRRKWNELKWIGCALGILALVWCYLWYESQKTPLSAQEMQSVTLTLSETPFVETETSRSGRSSSKRTFIQLHTVELPGLPLLLEGPAFDGAQVEALTQMLEAGDRIQVSVFKSDRRYLMRAMKSQEITGPTSVGVCALAGKGFDFLTLEAYDFHHRIKLQMMLLILSVNIGIVFLIAGWKYWQYSRI